MPRKFVVLTSQRSGSVFLERALSSHPDVHCFGELLLGMGGQREIPTPSFLHRQRQLRHVYASLRSGVLLAPGTVIDRTIAARSEAAVGFRAMHQHLTPLAIRKLRGDSFSVIFLSRDNVVRQVVSRAQMHDRQRRIGRGSAHSTETGAFGDLILVDPEIVVKEVQKLRARQEKSRSLFSGLPSISLTYESLIDGDAVAAEQAAVLCDFLDVPVAPLVSPTKKTGSRDLRDTVKNYAELVAGLEDAGLSDYLSDPT